MTGTVEASVTFTPRGAEVFRGARLPTAPLQRIQARMAVLLIVLGLCVVALSLIASFLGELLVVGLIMVGSGMLARFSSGADSSLWGRFAERRYPEAFRDATTVTIGPEGCRIVHGATRTERGWDGLTDWVDYPDFIVLRTGRLQALVVPKRAFPDKAADDAFTAVLAQHLPRGRRR